MALELVTAPAAEPFLLADAQAWAMFDLTGQDDVLTSLIKAVRVQAERATQLTLITSTWRLWLDAWPEDDIIRLGPPVQSVSSIKYVDLDGVLQTIDAADYRVDVKSRPARITPEYGLVWPIARDVINAIQVEYVAGFGSSGASVPEDIRIAMKWLLCWWNEHRNAQDEIPKAFFRMLGEYWHGDLYQ